ncbi:hypothetical protein M0805_009197 [Coniferiporia weirii]|nr:hypothetical protein M0805_009197 [Coniferiporia weirii]
MARSPSHLNPDVQKALQHAIGEVNNAASSSTADGQRKKRKRKGKDPAEATGSESAVNASTDHAGTDVMEYADEGDRERKRKKNGLQNMDGEPTPPQTTLSAPVGDFSAGVAPSKKKKRKKDMKGKQRVDPPPSDVPIDPTLVAHDNDNANAFLSAVMTAAAASSSSSPSAAAVSAAQQILNAHTASQNQAHHAGYVHYPVQYGMPGFPGLPPTHTPGFSPGALPPGFEGLNSSLAGEELARAVQNLDLPKLADALRSLGDTSASGIFPLPGHPGLNQPGPGRGPPPAVGPHGHAPILVNAHGHRTFPPSLPVGQVPVPSALILGQSPHNAAKTAGKASTPVMTSFEEFDPDHAHLLANKWLSATKLNELVKTKGLVYKKGKFSTSEEAAIKSAIENYRVKNGLLHEQVGEIIFAKGAKAKDTAFWFEITSQVPQRPVVAVYHHVRRSYHPMKQQGKWMPSEDDTLRQAVAEYGLAWEKVSGRVGRMAGDCRDRWRNHINNREERVMGSWSKEEEDRLTRIVMEMTTAQGKNQDQDVFWTQVAAHMGNTRSRNQCRIKWTDALSKTVKNEGQKPRWGQQDAYILVHKIASLNVHDDSEIDWKLLADEDWNLWSAHSLQRRWLTLKRSVRGYDEMSHQEIMDILRVKKAHAPPTPAPVKTRVTSAPMVPMDYQTVDVDINDVRGPITAESSGFTPIANLPEPIQHDFPVMPPAEPQGDASGSGLTSTTDAHDVQIALEESSVSSSSSSSDEDSDSDSSNSD